MKFATLDELTKSLNKNTEDQKIVLAKAAKTLKTSPDEILILKANAENQPLTINCEIFRDAGSLSDEPQEQQKREQTEATPLLSVA